LNYGAIPTDAWGWTDFAVGLLTGAYFPLRDHMRNDCYSGLFHTASLFIDIHKIFDKQTTTSADWA